MLENIGKFSPMFCCFQQCPTVSRLMNVKCCNHVSLVSQDSPFWERQTPLPRLSKNSLFHSCTDFCVVFRVAGVNGPVCKNAVVLVKAKVYETLQIHCFSWSLGRFKGKASVLFTATSSDTNMRPSCICFVMKCTWKTFLNIWFNCCH